MTVVVGVLCSNGVVIGADSSATFSAGSLSTVEQPTKKVFTPNNQCLVAGTGQVGLGQRFVDIVTKQQASKDFQALDHLGMARGLCHHAIQDWAQTQAPKGQYGSLVGMYAQKQFHLC